jgi:hypothetical protein
LNSDSGLSSSGHCETFSLSDVLCNGEVSAAGAGYHTRLIHYGLETSTGRMQASLGVTAQLLSTCLVNSEPNRSLAVRSSQYYSISKGCPSRGSSVKFVSPLYHPNFEVQISCLFSHLNMLHSSVMGLFLLESRRSNAIRTTARIRLHDTTRSCDSALRVFAFHSHRTRDLHRLASVR